MDVVYLVRAGVNEDLRYSLRSLAANVPHDRVWIVGHVPSWCQGVTNIPSRNRGNKWTNLPVDLLAAAKHDGLSETFSYWNDDFFAVAPVDGIPLHHRGLLAEYIGRRGQACSTYVMGMRQTLNILRSWGYPDPMSYETHMPLVMDRTTLRDALERALHERCCALAYRSLYGAVAGLAGTRIEDPKITGLRTGIPDGWSWVSTSDGSFEAGRIGRDIRAMFPDRCQYERVPR